MGSRRGRKAVSPVIASVILVAVAITVAVAVAYWMGGISGQYTKFEKIELTTAYSTRVAGSGWLITIDLRNTGTTSSTLNTVFINDKPLNSTGYDAIDFPSGAEDRIVTDIEEGGDDRRERRIGHRQGLDMERRDERVREPVLGDDAEREAPQRGRHGLHQARRAHLIYSHFFSCS